MTVNMLEIRNLNKRFGNVVVAQSLSFEVQKGEAFGIVGPNGAGKSTLMKILTTFIHADEGTAVVNGNDVNDSQLKVQQSVGYLPEHNPLYLLACHVDLTYMLQI